MIVFCWKNYQLPSEHNHYDLTHLEIIHGVKTQFEKIHHSDLYPVFVRVERETPTSGFMEYRNFYENWKWLSPSSISIF